MTKLILHGGRLRFKDKRNDEYFEELTKDLVDGDELLWVGFARETEEKQQAAFELEKQLILAQTNTSIVIVKAVESRFSEQMTTAKAIHITGGSSPKLMAAVTKNSNFLEQIQGKTVGGSSAGAAIFSTYYWSGHTLKAVNEGLGYLPIRLMVHYGNPEFNSTDENRKKLDAFPDSLELVLLQECEWRVFNV
jgi:peptidase E